MDIILGIPHILEWILSHLQLTKRLEMSQMCSELRRAAADLIYRTGLEIDIQGYDQFLWVVSGSVRLLQIDWTWTQNYDREQHLGMAYFEGVPLHLMTHLMISIYMEYPSRQSWDFETQIEDDMTRLRRSLVRLTSDLDLPYIGPNLQIIWIELNLGLEDTDDRLQEATAILVEHAERYFTRAASVRISCKHYDGNHKLIYALD